MVACRYRFFELQAFAALCPQLRFAGHHIKHCPHCKLQSIKRIETACQNLQEAHRIGIDLNEREISVSKVETAVDISIHYERDTDLLVHTLKLEFSPAAGNRNIMAK
jgi:hypothetical protein